MVLNEARSAAKPAYRKAVAWFRPAAWITTIGLCLAIVLEVADLPVEEPFDMPAKNEEMGSPAAEDTTVPPAMDPRSSLEQEPDRTEVESPATLQKIYKQGAETGRVSVDAASAKTAPAAAPERQSIREDAPAAIETDALKDSDMQFLREAERRARLQAGSDEEGKEVVVQGLAAYGVASEAAIERYCDAAETADPNDWLACINELENQGLQEAAQLERELLAEAFPGAFAPTELTPKREQAD